MPDETDIESPPSNESKVPIWFLIVSVIALLWNLMGLAVFGMVMTMLGNDEALAGAGLNEAQIELMNSTPAWVNIVFAVAVIGGVLGSVALLMRKRIAIPVLILSLLGVIAQNVYIFFLSNTVEVMGVGMSPLVIPIAIALVFFAMHGARKGWLR